MVFATHEVLIRGHSLRRIETGMQRMELSFLMALPTSHPDLFTLIHKRYLAHKFYIITRNPDKKDSIAEKVDRDHKSFPS